MTRSKKRRPSDMNHGDQGSLHPQSKNQQETSSPFRQHLWLGSNTSWGSRESRDYNGSGSCHDSPSLRRRPAETYRPSRDDDDSYKPRPTIQPHPTWDSYRPDSGGFPNSRAAPNEPGTSRTEDSLRTRGRSPFRRCGQQGASDEPSPGRFARPLPDRRDRNGIPNDARSRSPRSRDHTNGPAGSQRFRDSNSRSPLHAGKEIAIEVRNRPSGNNTRAPNPSESSWTRTRDFSKFSLTNDYPALVPESHNLTQQTRELSSLGEDHGVTNSARSQPNTNVSDPSGRERSPEDTSCSSDSRSFGYHRVYGQLDVSSGRSKKLRPIPVLRYEVPVPKLEPDDFLPKNTSADRGLYLKAGTPEEICVWKPDGTPDPGPNDSTWRTRDFTPSIRELVHGRARQAKNRASAALLPHNVPLFRPRIRSSRSGQLRSRKAKFRGSLEEYYQMLSDKKKQVHDDDTAFPTDSRGDYDPIPSSSSEEEDYDLTSLKNPWVFGRGFPRPKSQWGTTAENETQIKSKNGPPTNHALCASVPSESTHNTLSIGAKNDPPLAKAQEENPPKSEPQVISRKGPLTKDTLGSGSVPNGNTHSIVPTKKLAIARGKQLRPELARAMALLRASTSKSVDPERERDGGHFSLASESPPVTAPEILGLTSEKEGVLDPPNK